MTPYKAIQRMNKGFTYAFVNVKTNKVISIHKDWDKAWAKVRKTKGYRLMSDYCDDSFITHDVISLFDIAFKGAI